MLPFHIYDVFTDRAFTGNPLAIVEGADGLSTAQMQTIARQFNLSETIFVQKPDDSAHTAKVRIFFPTAEIPFAGHPTIGCALHLARHGVPHITLEEAAGLVPVTIDRSGAQPFAEFTAPRLPESLQHDITPAILRAGLSLKSGDLGPHSPGVFRAGPAFIYAPVTSTEVLARVELREPGYEGLIEAAHGVDAVYVYAPTGPGRYQARMFHPSAGVSEDPATGSATAILAGQLLANGALANGTNTFELAQGIEMGRPSALRLGIDMANGALTAIRVAGCAVPVAEGRIAIP